MTDEKKALEGEIIPKNKQLPSENDRIPGVQNLVGFSVRAWAVEKAMRAEEKIEDAQADLYNARARRNLAEERAIKAQERLTEENLENMKTAAAADITAELDEALTRQKTAEATRIKAEKDLNRQTKISTNDDKDEELRGHKLEAEINKFSKPTTRANKGDGLTKDQRDAAKIAEHGTTSPRGPAAAAELDKLKAKHGENEGSWPEEVRERARMLRLWKME